MCRQCDERLSGISAPVYRIGRDPGIEPITSPPLPGGECGELSIAGGRDVHAEIEALPAGLHSAVAEEEPIDFMKLRARESFPTRYFRPTSAGAVEDCVDDDVGHRLVVRVGADCQPVAASSIPRTRVSVLSIAAPSADYSHPHITCFSNRTFPACQYHAGRRIRTAGRGSA
jgi:hypothetical protein